MGTLLLLQIGLDLAFIAVVTVLLMERTKLRAHEDPRLSRGLQLLTSKIAILQDLMDRSEASSKQFTQLLEVKQQDVHETLEEVDRHLHKVQESVEKSKSVARLFQDRIPHEEVIERQTSAKYMKAAKLAHQGATADEIATQIDIPRGELDLIVKLNRHELISKDESVWLGEEDSEFLNSSDVFKSENAMDQEQIKAESHAKAVASELSLERALTAQSAAFQVADAPPPTSQKLVDSVYRKSGVTIENTQQVRPVIFKRIESNR